MNQLPPNERKKENGANLFYEKLGFVDTGIDHKGSGEIIMKYAVE